MKKDMDRFFRDVHLLRAVRRIYAASKLIRTLFAAGACVLIGLDVARAIRANK